MEEKSEGLSPFKPFSYYHQRHHFPNRPDGVPEEEWCHWYGAGGKTAGLGVGYGSMWFFFIFLILILLFFI
jgi:hypothetical protein